MPTVPLALALLLQAPFPTGLAFPPAKPGGGPLEITVPASPDACTKADLAKIADRIERLSARLDAIAAHSRACECSPAVAAVAPKPKAPAAPTVYRLADSSGQVWTHTDPAWLKTYVGQVNATVRPIPGAPVATPFLSPCAGGRCPR